MTNSSERDESEAMLRKMISALSGEAVDWSRVESDIIKTRDVLRIMANLWDFEGISSEFPATVFYAGWDEDSD